MDFIKFIGSGTMQYYLREIVYDPLPLEACVIVYLSDLPIGEKMEALNYIAENEIDWEIPASYCSPYQESLNLFLLGVIKAKNRLLLDAVNASGLIIDKDGNAYNSLKEVESGYDGVLKKVTPGLKSEIFITVNKGKISWIKGKSSDGFDDDEIERVLNGITVKFPQPFERGDFVICSKGENPKPFIFSQASEQMICDGEIISENYAPNYNAYGYYLDENLRLCYGAVCNYTDLDYYKFKASDENLILKIVSKLLNSPTGEEVELCINGFCYQRDLLKAKRQEKLLKKEYNETGLSLVGIKED